MIISNLIIRSWIITYLIFDYNGIYEYIDLLHVHVGPNSVGAIRLLNSGSTSLYNTAGCVQVWYGGQWGNICDMYEHFGSDEADVICHQLGWSGSSSYGTGEYYRLAV